MRIILAYAVYHWRRALREPITLGWSFGFPVVLLLLFGGVRPALDVTSSAASTLPYTAESATHATFFTMGLIGLNITSIGIFGLGLVLVQARSLGILQRLALTPQPAWKFIVGHVLSASVVALASALLLLTVGVVVFGVTLPQSPVLWGLTLLLGTFTFLSLGYALAASLHEVRTAQVVSNTVFLGLMCFGGVWFSPAAMPAAVRWLSLALPLSHFLKLLRATGEHRGFQDDWYVSFVFLVAWGLLMSVVAGLQFRWRYALES